MKMCEASGNRENVRRSEGLRGMQEEIEKQRERGYNLIEDMRAEMAGKETAMSKYERLWEYVGGCENDELKLSFENVGVILGFEIDHSFLNAKKELSAYGWQVGKISLKEKTVTFHRAACGRTAEDNDD